MLRYWLFVGASFLLPRLPTRFLESAGWVAGVLGFLLAPRARRAVLRNLATVCPELDQIQRRRLAVKTFVHGAWGYIELFVIPTRSPASIASDYPVVGMKRDR